MDLFTFVKFLPLDTDIEEILNQNNILRQIVKYLKQIAGNVKRQQYFNNKSLKKYDSNIQSPATAQNYFII